MKHMLLLLILLVLAVGCGDSAATPQPEFSNATTGPSDIQVAVVADDFAVGEPRLPLVLFSGPDQVADARAVRLTAFDLSVDPPAAVWSGEATSYSDYEVPYWVAYPQISHPGLWGLVAEITQADGRPAEAQLTIQVAESNQSPAIGSEAPASENRTLATEPDIAKLTSGTDPVPGLYEMTVAEAIQSGRPTVVTLATPAFCQTRFCGPVVHSLEAVYREYSGQANFIHLEIYKDFQELTVADEVEEWGLTSEPWTFILDRNGKVVTRLGGPVSPSEITAALGPLLQ